MFRLVPMTTMFILSIIDYSTEMLKLVQNEVTENKKKILKEVQETVSVALADVSKEILKVIQEDLQLMKEKLLQEGQETVSIAIQEVSKGIFCLFHLYLIHILKYNLFTGKRNTICILLAVLT
uniref:Uncharacterized protein n=1 Tax=Biomphalaria glabrata TaxID=6526 RepID=A0A2C9K4N8_BIOGL